MKEEYYYRILVVETDQDEANLIAALITAHHPAVVYKAFTADEATLLIDYHEFDLIFIDFDLPDNAGSQLSEYATKSFLNNSSPVIFLCQEENKERIAQSAGKTSMVDYIRKPVDHDELIRVLGLYTRFIKAEKEVQVRLEDEVKQRLSIEAELGKSKENFKNIVEKSNAGILIVDKKGIIQFINVAGEQIFLRNKKELIGSQFGQISGYTNKAEIDIIRKNGEVGIGEVTTVSTQWAGKPATLVMINDISAHKMLESNLEDAKVKAQESDRLKTAFLANMSHEIRTPLNGIMGFSQLLDSNQLNTEERHQYLNTIISCGNYLLGIINDIIDIAQIESGQMVISEIDFDLVQMVDEIHDLYLVNPKLKAKGLQLSLRKPMIESLVIHSDALRIKQVLVNLINNAIKFTNAGQINFGFELKDQQMIEFYVKDTGQGIPESEFENIFERFRQMEADKNSLNEGNGLGLSIAKALVNLLGGNISLESVPNVGSTFYFTIPVQIVSDNGSTKEKLISKIKGGFSGKKILIVEDEETNFLFLKSVIMNEGTIIYWAKNGEDAIEIAKSEALDLILMDMKLPVISGFDATREIRKLKPLVPIIAQTAYAMSSDKEKVMEAGCNDYISKPIKVNELMIKINNFLSLSFS